MARFKALCQCFQLQSRATGLFTRFLRYVQERAQEVLILALFRGRIRVSSPGRLLFCVFFHGKPLFHVSITCPHVLLQFIIKFGAYHTDAGSAALATNWVTGLFPMDFVGEPVLYRAGQSSRARNQPEELGKLEGQQSPWNKAPPKANQNKSEALVRCCQAGNAANPEKRCQNKLFRGARRTATQTPQVLEKMSWQFLKALAESFDLSHCRPRSPLLFRR